MTFDITDLGTPVITARLWGVGLAPRAGGGWNWIGQFYNYPNKNPTEWVVMNLETGSYTIDRDTPYITNKQGKYAKDFGIKNQYRAANGRIFFPAVSVNNWYYDPSDGRVHDLGKCPNGNGVTVTDGSSYSICFNQSGSLLCVGTIAAGTTDKRPMVYTLNPNTLAMAAMCRVGSAGHTLNGYAYYLWQDGDWLYVLVGQEIWDVVAVHIPSKTQTVLATETVNPWAYFVQKPEGLTVQLVKNNRIAGEVVSQYWLIDGALVPYVAGYSPGALPFTHRDVTPYKNAIVTPPQIDDTSCPQRLKWRAFGSTGAWTENPFGVVYAGPIPVQSIVVLPDKSIYGDVEQYQGAFRKTPGESIVNFGEFHTVTEGDARAVANGKLYISGYPNGALWEYDPDAEWSIEAPANPKKLGNYSNSTNLSGVKRAILLAYNASPSRLYMAGLRDRTAKGAGIGYYDFTSKTFAGHFTGLTYYYRRLGLAVVGSKVVLSGAIDTDEPGYPASSSFVIHDLNLVELERQTPFVGLLDAGKLFTTGEANVIVALSVDGQRIYRWNIATGTLINSVDLTFYGAVGFSTQNPDGRILVVLGTDLVAINPITLTCTVLGSLASIGAISYMAAVGE